jgi:hypothetical protein
MASSKLDAVPNINRPEFAEPREHEGFRARRARLGHQLGSERVGASLWELPAGQAAYPYHFHLADGELRMLPTDRVRDRVRQTARRVVAEHPEALDILANHQPAEKS